MPPLRARPSDLLPLAMHFLRKYTAENHKLIDCFDESAMSRLLSYRWPGNVRELENVIERAVVMCEGAAITGAHLPAIVGSTNRGTLRIPGSTLAEIERHAILSTLEAVGGSTAKAAQMLEISVRKIQYKLHDYADSSPTGERLRKGRDDA
jgi:two-component system response regulator HydG